MKFKEKTFAWKKNKNLDPDAKNAEGIVKKFKTNYE